MCAVRFVSISESQNVLLKLLLEFPCNYFVCQDLVQNKCTYKDSEN